MKYKFGEKSFIFKHDFQSKIKLSVDEHFQILRISMIKSFPTTHQKASWRQETTLIIRWSYTAQSNDEKKARQISMAMMKIGELSL